MLAVVEPYRRLGLGSALLTRVLAHCRAPDAATAALPPLDDTRARVLEDAVDRRLAGVPLVWWLAYRSGLGLTTDVGIRTLRLPATVQAQERQAPDWIAASLARVTER